MCPQRSHLGKESMKELSSLDARSVPPAPMAEVEHACVMLWSLLMAFVFSSFIFFLYCKVWEQRVCPFCSFCRHDVVTHKSGSCFRCCTHNLVSAHLLGFSPYLLAVSSTFPCCWPDFLLFTWGDGGKNIKLLSLEILWGSGVSVFHLLNASLSLAFPLLFSTFIFKWSQ